MHDIIVYALPLFALLMGVEFVYGLVRGRNNYALGDTLNSLGQGLLSQVVAVCTQLIQVGLYAMIFPHVALWPKAALWEQWTGVLLAVVLYDFCDYWLHRVSHESALFWAAHVVHHQSQHFNLSTALRQESFYGVTGWMFFLPLAVVGVPPGQFAIAGLVVLLYQFWIHTEHVGSLGVLDRIFSTPSNHRVHHAVNERYIDRNYGAILVVWDRLFGSFEPESERCVYGTREPLASWDPLSAVGRTYRQLFAKACRTRGWGDKLRVLFKSPSWVPPPAAAFVPREVPRYDPPASRSCRLVAVLLFALATLATAACLWRADDLGAAFTGMAAAGVVATLWAMGAVLEGRLPAWAAALGGGAASGMVVLLLARAA